MGDFGDIFRRNLIVGVFSLFGLGGIGSLIAGVVSLGHDSPVKSVIQDIAIDEVKEQAMSHLYSDDGQQTFSLANIFGSHKYKPVSDKGQGIFKYWNDEYYSEVYAYNNMCFVGDRRYNKPNDVNFAWNMRDGVGFEMGDYKKGVVYQGSYFAFDGYTGVFVAGHVKKGKLDGWCYVCDEFNETWWFDYYKKGKKKGSIRLEDDVFKYFVGDKVKGEYNFVDDEWSGKFCKGLNISDNSFGFQFDIPDLNVVYTVDFSDNQIGIMYQSDDMEFCGSPFDFKCTYTSDNNEWISYDYQAQLGVSINQSDGSYGEVKIQDTKDDLYALSSEILIEYGYHIFIDSCTEVVLHQIPFATAANEVLKITTGVGMENLMGDVVEDVIDGAKNVHDDIMDYREKEKEPDLGAKKVGLFEDENGTYYLLDSGAKVYVDTGSEEESEYNSDDWYYYEEHGLKIRK